MEQSQKNNKDFFYIISLLLITFVIVSLGSMYWEKDNAQENKYTQIVDGKILTEEDIVELMDGPYTATTTDQLVFNVMQNTNGPRIYKVIIAPQKVSRGEEQYLEVWVKDEQGVQNVKTITELDRGIIKELNLEIFEGDVKDGKWRAQWIVHDTHDETYNTKFIATSIDDRKSETTFAWLDPCSPPLTSDWNVNTTQTCDDGGIVGTEGGNIVLDGSVTFINTSLVFNPGKSITLLDGGQIILCTTCKIEKAYLFALDNDIDGQVPGTSISLVTATSATQGVKHASSTNIAASRHLVGKIIKNNKWYTSYTDLGHKKATLNNIPSEWVGEPWPGYVSQATWSATDNVPMTEDCNDDQWWTTRDSYPLTQHMLKYSFSGGYNFTNGGVNNDYNCDGTAEGDWGYTKNPDGLYNSLWTFYYQFGWPSQPSDNVYSGGTPIFCSNVSGQYHYYIVDPSITSMSSSTYGTGIVERHPCGNNISGTGYNLGYTFDSNFASGCDLFSGVNVATALCY